MWSRVVVDEADTPLAELGMIGRSKQPEAVSGHLPQHSHPTYELVYVVEGSVKWWVGNETHELNSGDLYLTRPDEIHGAVDEALEPCDISWMQFALDHPGAFGMEDIELARLQESLNGPMRVARPNAMITHHLDRLLTESLRSPDRQAACRSHAVLVLDLAAQAFESQHQPQPVDDVIEAATIWMNANLRHKLSVTECAAALGVQPSRLFEGFREQLGTTPNEWLTRRRIDLARQRLKVGDPISTTAFDLGFSSTQYFATVFKRYTGSQPSKYRETAANQSDEQGQRV